MKLRDAVVVITGASSGIGEALARLLAADGCRLVLAARRRPELERLVTELAGFNCRAIAVPTDVTVRGEAEALIAQTLSVFGRIDVLVNNAGRGHLGTVEETTDDVIQNIFAVNVFALWHTTRPALRAMKLQGSGHVINVASMAGKIGFPFNSAYVAAKHATVGFTRALRLELIETGVEASVICPAGVLTPWAAVTEGGPMLPLFEASGPFIDRIAAERSIALPAIEDAIAPERVAASIRGCMLNPEPEVYTHRGAREFALLAAADPAAAEERQLPSVLGEREAYRQMLRH